MAKREPKTASKLTLTYAETLQALVQLKAELAQAVSDQGAARRSYDEADRAVKKAAGTENFELAQTHKQIRDAHQKARKDADAVVLARLEDREKLQAHAQELFKVANPFPKATVTLNRVIVVDPETNVQDSAYYLSDHDEVELTVGELSFSDEAGDVSTWAKKQGFLCFLDSQAVTM